MRLLRTCKQLYITITKQHISDRILPYKKYFKYKQWNQGLLEAASRSNIPQVIFFVRQGADNKTKGLCKAAFIGNRTLVDCFIDLGARNWLPALDKACLGGHKDLAEYFLEQGGNMWFHRAFIYASRGGHLGLVQYFWDKFKASKSSELFGIQQSQDLALEKAATGGYWKVIEFWLQQGANGWKRGLIGAAKSGDLKLVEFFYQKGELEYIYHAMCEAAKRRHLHIVEFLVDNGAGCFDTGLRYATLSGDQQMIDYFVEKGASAWDAGLNAAASIGNVELMKFFIQKGATNFASALNQARSRDHREAVKLMIEHGVNYWDMELAEELPGMDSLKEEICSQQGQEDEFGLALW